MGETVQRLARRTRETMHVLVIYKKDIERKLTSENLLLLGPLLGYESPVS
jgi:hypothetical protein